jgi:hypothetical protein
MYKLILSKTLVKKKNKSRHQGKSPEQINLVRMGSDRNKLMSCSKAKIESKIMLCYGRRRWNRPANAHGIKIAL